MKDIFKIKDERLKIKEKRKPRRRESAKHTKYKIKNTKNNPG
jgi:hypothetical protein